MSRQRGPGAESLEEASRAGVRLSHPERVYSHFGITKLHVARYYEAIGEWGVAETL